jgi:hypothetical protein
VVVVADLVKLHLDVLCGDLDDGDVRAGFAVEAEADAAGVDEQAGPTRRK